MRVALATLPRLTRSSIWAGREGEDVEAFAAVDLCLHGVRLSVSAEPRSGFREPFLTATPIAARAMSVHCPAPAGASSEQAGVGLVGVFGQVDISLGHAFRVMRGRR